MSLSRDLQTSTDVYHVSLDYSRSSRPVTCVSFYFQALFAILGEEIEPS